MKTKLKICGLHRLEDIVAVNEFPPDYVGFILHFPKSHRNITAEMLQEWKPLLNPRIKTVGVFVNQSLETIAQVASFLDVIQLHGTEPDSLAQSLKESYPEKELWKAFAIKTPEDIHRAFLYAADKILLDYGKGEGKTFDWSLLHAVEKPYILAGGIDLENIHKALEDLSPEIIDLSSGVETNGEKDPEKIKQLYEIMQRR